jgi:hypothetical protein
MLPAGREQELLFRSKNCILCRLRDSEKAYLVTYQKSGSVAAIQAALAELPESMANDRDVLAWHLFCALTSC